jgi:4-hydroxybenzoate polyprenyltransferase
MPTTTPQSSADDRAAPAAGLIRTIGETADLVVFKHSVFALPFALMSLITATGADWPSPWTWCWVVVAMVAARTSAMSFNRLADHSLDAANPRTAGRALPAGRLGRGAAWILTIGAAAVFVAAAGALNRLCLLLSLPTLGVLLGYSYGKRFTLAVHLWLGVALGLAPVGAWIAATGSIGLPAVVLGIAVTLWVAGFDTIYSLQDEAFDRAYGLRSLPAALGPGRALGVSRLFHLLALAGFAAFAAAAGGGFSRWSAVAAAGLLLVWQHHLVRAGGLARVDAAFFTANGLLSAVMFALFVAAKLAG